MYFIKEMKSHVLEKSVHKPISLPSQKQATSVLKIFVYVYEYFVSFNIHF